MAINLRLDWATYESAKYACENYHYSRSIPTGKTVKIGCWENERFIGVIIFSYGANNNACKYFKLSQQECCELTRIALTEHETSVSRLMSIALKMLKKQSPGLKLVFSYSDKTNQNHHGGVYQANGWLYLGERTTGSKGAYYKIKGKKIHGRSARAKYVSEKQFPKGWSHWPSETKHLYLKILDAHYKNPFNVFKYPKRAVSKENVATLDQGVEGSVNLTTALQSDTIV